MDNNKSVLIFPYINIDKIIKMDDFEIHPLEKYNLKEELDGNEILRLNNFANSFKQTFFNEGEIPKDITWIWILKHKWNIVLSKENSSDITEKIKILFLLLKLHISIDFFNQWMSIINIKALDFFECNLSNDYIKKFWNSWKYKNLQTTNPENIRWFKDIKFLPIPLTINNIPTTFSIVSNSDEILWIDKNYIDMTSLYKWIIKNKEYYKKFLNIASLHLDWLEKQEDIFFYYAIIPSIIEVLLYPNIDKNDIKKQKATDYGKKLDELIIKNNEKIETIIYVNNKWISKKETIWLIARTIVSIYDMRNDLLHEWKKSFNKMKVNFKWYDLRIYDVFQLFFKFSILTDFIENKIIENEFVKLSFEWNIFTTWNIKILWNKDILYMDDWLDLLLEKAKSDKELKQWLYEE